jgi:DoxX-like family
MDSMALPRRQRRLLEAIDRQLASADPRLARLLGTFGRFWADEPLPAHEQLPVRTGPSWSGPWRVLAAGGLTLPALLGIAPVLVPLAATGLATIMVGAAIVESRRQEFRHVLLNLAYLALAAFVAFGRFGPWSFPG